MNVPPKGTYARAYLELAVVVRRASRALETALPGGSQVPYAEAGRIIYRWMARMGIGIAVITGVVALVVHLTR